jgi:inner membrane transporter RhtA
MPLVLTVGPTRVAPRSLPPIPAVLIALVSNQTGSALGKTLFPAFGPSGTTGLRLALAAVLLLAIYRPPLRRLTAQQWKAIVPYGVALGATNLTYYLSIQTLPIGMAVTVSFIGPLVVALIGSRRPSDGVWVAMAATGIALVAPWSGAESGLEPIGLLLALLSATCWGAYILLGARLALLLPTGQAVPLGTFFAALTVAPMAAPEVAAAHFTPQLAGTVLAVAALASALPLVLELVALKALPSKTFGVLMSLGPAVAALVALLFFGEALTPAQWASVLCVSAASAGSTLTAPRAAATSVATEPVA